MEVSNYHSENLVQVLGYCFENEKTKYNTVFNSLKKAYLNCT